METHKFVLTFYLKNSNIFIVKSVYKKVMFTFLRTFSARDQK